MYSNRSNIASMLTVVCAVLFGMEGSCMMIGNTGAFLTGKLPYDAEVEYIESTGTQWIDTGVTPTNNTGVKIDFTLTDANNVRGLFGETGPGLFAGGGSFSLYPGIPSNNIVPIYIVAYGGYSSETINLPVGTRAIHHLNYMASGTAGVDGYMTKTLTDPGSLKAYNLFIFALNCGGQTDSRFMAARRLYSCKMTLGETLITDIIPVRFTNEQGQSEGAMYDRANPTVGMDPDGSARSDGLYRNRGVGAFVIGSDKTT